jgi:hypothetical protein
MNNHCLQLNEKTIDFEIKMEQSRGVKKFGGFNSAHELYAILKEELDEFWESVRNDDPDPEELLQICAVARRGILELCEKARRKDIQNEKDD